MKTTLRRLRRFASYADVPKTYRELCQFYLPRPIRDAVDYANVTEVTDAMVLWHDDFTLDQRDYFDLLCSLIEDYDTEHESLPEATALDVLKHLMDEHRMTGADLSRVLGGSRNLGTMILRGDRNLTLTHIRKLAKHFHVGAEVFI